MEKRCENCGADLLIGDRTEPVALCSYCWGRTPCAVRLFLHRWRDEIHKEINKRKSMGLSV